MAATQRVSLKPEALEFLAADDLEATLAEDDGVELSLGSEETDVSTLRLAAAKAVGLVVRVPRGMYDWRN